MINSVSCRCKSPTRFSAFSFEYWLNFTSERGAWCEDDISHKGTRIDDVRTKGSENSGEERLEDERSDVVETASSTWYFVGFAAIVIFFILVVGTVCTMLAKLGLCTCNSQLLQEESKYMGDMVA
jgi:hypothetical protein